MLGIEFPELMVIAVVALIVIGPEHLPKVARTMGHLWGRAQRYINGVKADMSRDLALDELREFQQKTKQEIGNFEQSMTDTSKEWDTQVKEFESELTASKYDLGNTIPKNEVSNQILPRSELLKSEMPKMPKKELARHEIIEEHHAVLPISTEQNKTPDIS